MRLALHNHDMNENDAREVVLVRAIEMADQEFATLSQEDRQYASRAAAELTRWSAAEKREPASAERYLAQRAHLLIGKLSERRPAVRRAAAAVAWRPWIDALVPLVALVAGVLFERIGDRGQVNVLAFPLLVLVLWNLAVYLLLVISGLRGAVTRGAAGTEQRGLRTWLLGLARHAAPRGAKSLDMPLGRFMQEWAALSAPLTGARIARVLHLAAALFAAGAVAGLYVRGLVFDYRAGWESTFLDASQVHMLLSAVLGPAAQALGQAFPSPDEIAALQFPTSSGESAARWIHWYALTVAALVIVPRLALWAWAAWRAQRHGHRIDLDLSAPYFRRLLGGFSRGRARLRVLPYSFTLDEAASDSLRTVARRLLGEDAELLQRPSVAFGEEARAVDGAMPADAQVALNLALFNLSATPEQENHGAFLDALRAGLPPPHAMLVDEGAYRRRLGAQPGSDERLAQRRDAWRAFAHSRGWPIAIADLAAPDLAQIERDLGAVLGQTA